MVFADVLCVTVVRVPDFRVEVLGFSPRLGHGNFNFGQVTFHICVPLYSVIQMGT